MWRDFKTFIMRGSILDLAAAVVIGAAFAGVIKTMVDDVIMPPIGLVLGKVDFSNLYILLQDGAKAAPPYATLTDAKAAGAVTIGYGLFLNSLIGFFIVATAIFLVLRAASRMIRKAAPSTRECPFCVSTIPLAATRCPNCTSQLGNPPATPLPEPERRLA
jgi:large conductance mechanosensitive channel